MLVFLCSVPAYAEGGTINIEEEAPVVIDSDISIKARMEYSAGLPEFPITDGSGGGKLPDGTEISVTGAPTGAVILVVRKIAQTETEPYKWFKEVLGNREMQAYEIFFRDAEGNRIDADGAAIKVSTPDGMTNITVCSVDPDNSNAKFTANIKDGKAIFRTDGSRYYVLAGTKSGITPTPDPDREDENIPNAGNDFNMMFWINQAVVAPIGMMICLVFRKRQKKEDDAA